MKELTNADLHFVLSRCPRDILKLLRKHAGKLFLAGGFIRATIAGEKCSDVDLFGGDKDFLLSIAKDLAYERKGRHFSTDNAITVLSPPRFPVQFITRWLFSDPEKLIDSFDFTVCQSAIWAEEFFVDGVDGKDPVRKISFRSFCSDSFYSDLAARRLVYTMPIRDEDAGGSMLRVIKFTKKGYNIQAPSLAGVISRIASSIDLDRIEYKMNMPREEAIARVIASLLREVDPLTIVDGVDFVDEHQIDGVDR